MMSSNNPEITSTSELDLRLPHLNIINSSRSTSSTDEPFITGLLERVVFKVWGDFDNELTKALQATTEVIPRLRGRAEEDFNKIRTKANEVYENAPDNVPRGVLRRVPGDYEGCYAMTDLYTGDEDPRISYDTETSVPMYENVFEGVLKLLTGIFKKDKIDFQFLNKQFCLVGTALLKQRSPIPDRVLVTMTMRKANAPPVSAFELKGPAVPLGERAKSYCRKNVAGAYEQPGQQQALETLCGNRGCKHEVASEGMCMFFNYLFSSLENFNNPTGTDMHKTIAKMVAQSLIQALTCKTGCCFLYTYELGIAFEVKEFSEDGKIVVQTSSLFCCGNQRGAAAALLAVAKYSKEKEDKEKDCTDNIKRIVEYVLGGFQRRNTGGESNASRGLRSAGTAANKSGGRQGATNSRGGQRAATCSELAHCGTHIEEGCDATNGMEVASALSQEGNMSDVTEDVALEAVENMVRDVLKAQKQILGSGASGLVYSSHWQGRKVALKLWNGHDTEGLMELRREIGVYKYIEENKPSLLGSSVPNLLLTLDTTTRDEHHLATVALVTDYVGEGLSRDVDGDLWVGEGVSFRRIGPNDEKKIRDAALKCIELLHRNYIMHRDVALRNLRVEEVKRGSEVVWEVWLIDLGRAFVGSSFPQTYFDDEAKNCASLFNV